MLSRMLARSAPRAASQWTALSVRQFSVARRPLLSASLRIAPVAAPRLYAPFSSSSRRQDDDELVLKLAEEIKIESQAEDQPGLPESLDRYLKKSEFELIDSEGQEEVTLQKKTDTETIRVTFGVSNAPYDDADHHDEAYGDEESFDESTQPPTEDSLDARSDNVSFPIRLNISVTKPSNAGALVVEAVSHENQIVIENMYFFKDAELADPKSPEAEFRRRDVYAGPAFSSLDSELQALFEVYLHQRGVNEEMATFIPDYVDFKEQGEYTKWLGNVKGFLE